MKRLWVTAVIFVIIITGIACLLLLATGCTMFFSALEQWHAGTSLVLMIVVGALIASCLIAGDFID